MGAAKPDNQGKSYDADWEILDPREQDYRDALGDGLEIVLDDGGGTDEPLAELRFFRVTPACPSRRAATA